MAEHKGLPILAFGSHTEWNEWLAQHRRQSTGLWLKLAKKDAGVSSVSKAQAIETAIAHGWIDGQLDRFDEQFWLVRFTPRSPKSNWSQINRATALELTRQGRMTPAGLAEIDRAKADGRWDAAYAPHSRAEIPPDFQKALDANSAAAAFFGKLKGVNRYAVLYRIHDATTPKTRARRIDRFVAMLARGETVYPAKP